MNINNGICTSIKAREGFTLIDLVVVTAVLAVLVGLLLPALAATKAASQAMFCLNNKKQLIIAFTTYASDNLGRFPGNFTSSAVSGSTPPSSSVQAQAPWISGSLDWRTTQDNTNFYLLTLPPFSSLSPFLGRKIAVYKCPSDQYISEEQRRQGWSQRVRSISASFGVGSGDAPNGPWDSSYYIVNQKFSEMVQPEPSRVWVYTDEHPDSINDPGLFNPYKDQWIDLPASYHEGGTTFACADGHVELHKWQASAKNVPLGVFFNLSPPVNPNDKDILWMREHSPHK